MNDIITKKGLRPRLMSLLWMSAKDELPTGMGVLLVTGSLHKGIALAEYDGKKNWDVQPFKAAWYQTDTSHIEDWITLNSSKENEVKGMVYNAIKDIFEGLQQKENE